MNRALDNALVFEEEQGFLGWDFSCLESSKRMIEFPLSWNFKLKLNPFLITAESMLDMGTDDGEYLISLQSLPKITKALVSNPQKVSIARAVLDPIGVEVHELVDETNLPFNTGSFDLIMNRHNSFDSLEVYRLLKPDGQFVTQQI
ncbi:MAG: class I SAM-dependent methyltransferase, partial [Turicibacter sp.]